MVDKKQVRLTGPNGTVVRMSDDEAKRIGGGWKSEKAPAKTAAKAAEKAPAKK